MNDESDREQLNPSGPAWRTAEEYGVDMSLLEYLMSLTPAERLARHDQALALVRAMHEAGMRHYGYDPRPAENAR